MLHPPAPGDAGGPPAGRAQPSFLPRARPPAAGTVADILYLKADLKYVTARTKEREYLLDESLMHLETEFAARFIRPASQRVLVAKDAITGFERNTAEDADTHWLALLRRAGKTPGQPPAVAAGVNPTQSSCRHERTDCRAVAR